MILSCMLSFLLMQRMSPAWLMQTEIFSKLSANSAVLQLTCEGWQQLLSWRWCSLETLWSFVFVPLSPSRSKKLGARWLSWSSWLSTLQLFLSWMSEESKKDKEITQDENAVIALLLPACSCWTDKLTSNRLLIRARHVVALTPSTPVSSNGHFGEAQIAVVITWSHCTTSARDSHHMPIYSHLVLPTTTSGLHSAEDGILTWARSLKGGET